MTTPSTLAYRQWPLSTSLSVWFTTLINRLPTLIDTLKIHENLPLQAFDFQSRYQHLLLTMPPSEALRRLRQEHFALCLLRDVEHRAPVGEIVESMSEFADFAIKTAHDIALAELAPRFGLPRSKDGHLHHLHIIGMGKLGGRELNVSSDIDLVFLYANANDGTHGETDGLFQGQKTTKTLSWDEFFNRLGRRLINILHDLTDEGRVFRVDMRLRPHGDSGPLVCSFESFEQYLITEGREWERYAWIKGRLIIGDRAQELHAIVQPFVFRKYLDFGALSSMQEMHQQIREQVQRKDMVGNIKLGAGGIREIEFIAQVLQLMRGGRRPELQKQPTLEVLSALAQAGFMNTHDVETLKRHYYFLRRLEHRLQYREDQQTQTLPDNHTDLTLIAQSLAMSLDDFSLHLATLQKDVSTAFSALFQEPPSSPPPAQPQNTLESAAQQCWPLPELMTHTTEEGTPEAIIHKLLKAPLATLGLPNALAEQLYAHAQDWRIMRLRNQSLDDHKKIILYGLQAAATQTDGALILQRMLNILAVLAKRPSYLSLLTQSPSALQRLWRFIGASSWGVDFLGQHPILLDDLLDPRLLEQRFERAHIAQQLAAIKSSANNDVGRLINALREMQHAAIFRLLAQDLEGALTVEKLSDHLSDVADEILAFTLQECWLLQKNRHLDAPKMAIIAYGKLGGKELGYASDLDLVFICDESETTTDGAVGDPTDDKLPSYIKTAMSCNSWLTTLTEAGSLYETDFRLRPNGDSGLLVSSFRGFAEYQEKSAWLWEHQAITRARFCAGDKNIGDKFEKLRATILQKPREIAALKKDIVMMRQKMHAAHQNKSDLFDVKHDKGGLIDIEFIVQYGVLGYSQHYPDLTGNLGNIALLKMLADHAIIAADLSAMAANAYRHYRHQQHRLRLNGQRYARVEPELFTQEREAVNTLWHGLFGDVVITE